TAVQLDRVVLASAAGGAAGEVAGGRVAAPGREPVAPRVRVSEEGRTRVRARVEGVDGPFWLVLGQSHSRGWTARVDGEDLGEPRL
ncbi:hypothetical protein OFO05_32615, partial [Escherichia coli]|nr:hypothetical protein [Escherichia coli]